MRVPPTCRLVQGTVRDKVIASTPLSTILVAQCHRLVESGEPRHAVIDSRLCSVSNKDEMTWLGRPICVIASEQDMVVSFCAQFSSLQLMLSPQVRGGQRKRIRSSREPRMSDDILYANLLLREILQHIQQKILQQPNFFLMQSHPGLFNHRTFVFRRRILLAYLEQLGPNGAFISLQSTPARSRSCSLFGCPSPRTIACAVQKQPTRGRVVAPASQQSA